MAIGYFLRIGDKTTCGGQILTGDNTFQFYGASAARQGDIVTCGKHSGTYNILGGISNVWGNGRMMAGTLDSFSSCPCKARLINSIQDSYAKEDEPVRTRMAVAPAPEPENAYTQTPQPSNPLFTPVVDNRIRIDAQQLIDCADEICEKHLYFPDIKNAFKSEIEAFAALIVEQVESGQISYEQGSSEIKEEEKNLSEQAFDWLANGLSILGGLGLTAAGIALCSTGAGCLIGAPIIAHGLNGMYEGTMGIYEGNSDVQGPLREGYKSAAKTLGFNESVGNLTYDLVDMGLSIRGKLQLVPKLTRRYGEKRKIKPFVLFRHAREDLDYAFRQANKYLLTSELASDAINISKIMDDLKNAFVLDKETGTLMLSVAEPEKITTVEYIMEHCNLIMLITSPDDLSPSYYRCKDKKGNDYNVTQDGKLMKE
ncbi:MAG: DUF4225 domain-containing protein [Providencia heimbachae]|nr:DUF4225 domain-containing protein [Providencia heimbachae]